MTETESVWKSEQTAKDFLDDERGAVPCHDLQIAVIEKIVRSRAAEPAIIMDLGCGNGILGRSILDNFPETSGVFVDFSDTMLDAAREGLCNNPNAILLNADFGEPSWVETVKPLKPFDVIVSGFAIHHQPDKRKKELYSEIHGLLVPGGVFLNLEHVASSTPRVGKIFEDFYTDRLYEYRQKSDTSVSREEVKDSFVNRPDKKEDILAPVELQCEWLRETGFADVDCFFRLFEIAIFGGRKAGGDITP